MLKSTLCGVCVCVCVSPVNPQEVINALSCSLSGCLSFSLCCKGNDRLSLKTREVTCCTLLTELQLLSVDKCDKVAEGCISVPCCWQNVVLTKWEEIFAKKPLLKFHMITGWRNVILMSRWLQEGNWWYLKVFTSLWDQDYYVVIFSSALTLVRFQSIFLTYMLKLGMLVETLSRTAFGKMKMCKNKQANYKHLETFDLVAPVHFKICFSWSQCSCQVHIMWPSP